MLHSVMAKAKQGKSKSRGSSADDSPGDDDARPKKAKAKKSGPRRSWPKLILLYSLAACVWVAALGGCAIAYFWIGLPAIDEAVLVRRPNVTIVDGAGARTCRNMSPVPSSRSRTGASTAISALTRSASRAPWC
jgi:hypothetical protein